MIAHVGANVFCCDAPEDAPAAHNYDLVWFCTYVCRAIEHQSLLTSVVVIDFGVTELTATAAAA